MLGPNIFLGGWGENTRAGASILIMNVSLATAPPSDCHSRWVLKGLVLVIPGVSDSQPVKALGCPGRRWDLVRDLSEGNKSFGPISYRIFIISLRMRRRALWSCSSELLRAALLQAWLMPFLYKLV